MKTQLNGINYSEQLLTDEEVAVIKAVRNGGYVNLFVNVETEQEAKRYVESFPNHKEEWTNYHENTNLITITTEGQKTSLYVNYDKKSHSAGKQ